jgi:predicted aspartyl protease
MKLRLERGLLLCQVQIFHGDQTLELDRILVDTGSAGCVFQTEELRKIGVEFEPDDELHRIRGVGGSEFVFSKRLAHLQVGHLSAFDFQVEVGWMDYGFSLHGIVGLDFLLQTRAVIDLATLELQSGSS